MKSRDIGRNEIISQKPVEAPLSEIINATTDKMVDRVSSVEIYSTVPVNPAGTGWCSPPMARPRRRRMLQRYAICWD
jgi:hypothetical protein